VIWVVDELKKPLHYRLRLRLASRLTDAQSDTHARAAYDSAIAAKGGLASGQRKRWAARVAQRRGKTELAARPIVKVRAARIVVSPWRPPIRSIGGALMKSRHGVAVFAEVPPMGISLRGNCRRTKRNCRACEKGEGSVHHRLLRCPQPTFKLRVNGSMRTRFRPTGLQLVKTLT
jgi:hypothetical protein